MAATDKKRFEKIDEFLAKLPADSGFVYGVRERLAVHQLLFALIDQGEMPRDISRLSTLIGPLICTSDEQQRSFRTRFEAEFGRKPPPPPPPPTKSPKKLIHVVTLLVCLGLALLGWKAVKSLRVPGESLNIHPPVPKPPAYGILAGRVLNTKNEPVANADVWMAAQESLTDSKGNFSFTVDPSMGPIQFLVSQSFYGSRMQSVDWSPSHPVTIRLGSQADSAPIQIEGSKPSFSIKGSRAHLLFSADGNIVAAATDGGDITAHYLNPSSDRPVFSATSAFNSPFGISPDGKYFVANTFIVAVGSAINSKQDVGLKSIDRILFSPDGKSLITYGQNQAVLFRLHDSKWIRSGSISDQAPLCFTPDSTTVALLASYGADLFGVTTSTLKKLSLRSSSGIRALAIGPAGLFAFANSSEITLMDQATGQIRRVIPGTASDLSFSLKGDWLLAQGNKDSTWLYPVYKEGLQDVQYQDPVGAAFTQKGTLLVAYKYPKPPQRNHWPWYVIGSPMLLIGMVWAWVLFNGSRLRRYSSIREHTTMALSAPNASHPFQDAQLKQLGPELRGRKPIPSSDLAIEETLTATVNRCGFFTPVFSVTKVQREFLILIHKVSELDQHARLYKDLCSSLIELGVHIACYTYQSSPRFLREAYGGKKCSLQDLAANYPLHDLWVIADPSTLADPLVGVASWVPDLSRWRDRSFLSPVLIPSKSGRILESLGFRISTASILGIGALLETAESERLLSFRSGSEFPLPLQDVPARWLDRTPPLDHEYAEMYSELRRYLGTEGFLLTTACAVYPELNWQLTSWLGEKLCRGRRDDVLARVTSLPWFRHGWMPDWLRIRLIKRLSPPQEARIRGYIDLFLSSVTRGEGNLRFAKSRGNNSEAHGPLQDYVMLEFLAAHKPDENLAVRPPSLIRRILFRDGRVVPRITTVLVVSAMLLALIIPLWLHQGAPTVQPAMNIQISEFDLPSSASTFHPTDRPTDSTRRAIVEVADALAGSRVANDEFINTVTSTANYFVMGAKTPLVRRPLTSIAEPGLGVPRATAAESDGIVTGVDASGIHVVRSVGGHVIRSYLGRSQTSFLEFSGTAPTPDLPSAPSCSSSTTADETLDQIARAYEETRQKMPSGDTRTLRMTDLINAAGRCADYLSSRSTSNPFVANFDREADGFRIVGLGLAEAFPKGNIHLAIEGIQHSRSAFEQYQALMLAEALSRDLTASESSDLKNAIEGQIDKTITTNDMSRWQPAQDILRSLSGSPVGLVPGQVIAMLEGHTGPVFSAAFSSDGQHVVTSSIDNTARVWDASTGREVGAPLLHEASVNSVAFSPDGRRVVTSSLDNTARVWDASTGREVGAPLLHEASLNSAAFSPDGQRVVTASRDKTARVWDATTGREVGAPLLHEDSVNSATFSPDGKRVVTASDDRTARVWDASTGQLLAKLEGHTNRVNSAAFSPDGKRVVTASDDNTARVWNTATGQLLAKLEGHTNRVNSAAFSPDGQRVLTSSLDNKALVWNAATGQLLAKLEGHTNRVNSAAFSPDGNRVVTASSDNTARIWNAATGQLLAELEGHTNRVNSAAFSPDGKRVVTASDDKTARVWNAAPAR